MIEQMLKRRIDDLEYRLDELRSAFGVDWVAPACLRLSGATERILGALYKNHLVTKEGLRIASLPPACRGIDDRLENVNIVQISKLRGKVARFRILIDNVHGVGYRLTPESRKIIAGMLREELQPDLQDIFSSLKPPPFDASLGSNIRAIGGMG